MTPCVICKAPTKGAYLCRVHIRRLETYLGDVPALAADLEVTRTRQDRLGSGGVGIVARTAERPVPWSERASAATARLRTVLVAEIRDLVETRGLRPSSLPADTLPAMAGWLLRHIQSLALSEAADESYSAIEGAVRHARHVVDRPPDAWYAGPCEECTTDLYARAAHATTVRCRVCSQEYDLDDRRQWLLRSAEDYLLTSAEMSRALSGLLDEELSASTVRGWVSHRRLIVRGYLHHDQVVAERIDPSDRPLIRVGDVLELRAQQGSKAG